MGGKSHRGTILGKNIAALRVSRGIGPEQVCVDLNIALKSLMAWEEGRSWCPYPTLARLCSYYGFTDIYKLITVEMRFTFNPLLQQCG